MATVTTPRVASRSQSPSPASPSSAASASIKSYYRSATSAFLIRDYVHTSQSLHSAQQVLSSSASTEALTSDWVHTLAESNTIPPKVEWARKLTIFEITFLATCRSHPVPIPAPSGSVLHPTHQYYIDLPIDALIPTLWSRLILQDPTGSSSTDILASPLASSVHPSLVVALALAALKLDQPRQARAALEAYLGSISEQLESLIEAAARSVDWALEFQLDETMSMSMHGHHHNTNTHATNHMSSAGVLQPHMDVTRALLASWLKVVDLLSLHVLPRLGHWEAAGDFIRLQSVENAGWIGDVRLDAALQHLAALQRVEIEQSASREQRIRAQKEAVATAAASALAMEQQQAVHHRARTNDKGKARAITNEGASKPPRHGERHSFSDLSSNGSPGSSSSKSSHNGHGGRHSSGSRSVAHDSHASETGFAAMRSSLTSYLSQSVPSTTSTSSSALSSNRSLSTALLENLKGYDPVRLLSTVCVAFALVTWVRRTTARRRADGKSGLGVVEGLWTVVGKLGEVVKMGTKVTQL